MVRAWVVLRHGKKGTRWKLYTEMIAEESLSEDRRLWKSEMEVIYVMWSRKPGTFDITIQCPAQCCAARSSLRLFAVCSSRSLSCPRRRQSHMPTLGGPSIIHGRPNNQLIVKVTFDRYNKRITFSSARNCSYDLLRLKVCLDTYWNGLCVLILTHAHIYTHIR